MRQGWRLTDTERSLCISQSYSIIQVREQRPIHRHWGIAVLNVSSAKESVPVLTLWDSSMRSGSGPWIQEHMLADPKPKAIWLGRAGNQLPAPTGLKVNPREEKHAGNRGARRDFSSLPLQSSSWVCRKDCILNNDNVSVKLKSSFE